MSAYRSQSPPTGYYGQLPPQNGGYYQQKPAASDSYQLQETKPQQYEKSNIVDENKINQSPKYNDVWASILFLLCLLSYAILGGMGVVRLNALIESLQNDRQLDIDGVEVKISNNVNTQSLLRNFGISLAVAIGSGFLITVAYFFLIQRFAGKMIWITCVLTILLNIAIGIAFLVNKKFEFASITLICALLFTWIFYSFRNRIPFAKVVLKTAARVTGQFPATMFAGFIGLCVEIGLTILFFLSVAGWMFKKRDTKNDTVLDYDKGDLEINPEGYAVFVYMSFCFCWCSQVVRNTVHVTVSGLFATVYFMGTADRTRQFKVTVPVQNPTAKSAKRALTTSFGSICYGSLIVALIETVRSMVGSAAQQSQEDGNLFAFFCLYCLGCILRMIQYLVEYFNKYAFTQVAIYGKDFCTAGKDTWRLVKSRGVDAIINDSLIGSALGFGALLAGLLAGGLALLVLQLSLEDSSKYSILIATLGLITGIAEFNIMAEVITSGVTTIFVCLAEDPYALQRTQPELFQKVVEVYPEVMNPT